MKWMFHIKKMFGLVLFSASSALANSPPPEFKTLALGQDEFLTVQIEGQSYDVARVHITPDTLTFLNPDDVIRQSYFAGMRDSDKNIVLSYLKKPLPRHDGEYTPEVNEDVGCVYNEESQTVVLLINPTLKEKVKHAYFTESRNNVSPAFISQQAISLSYAAQEESVGGNGYWALGAGDKGYVMGDWNFAKNNTLHAGSYSAFRTENLFYRRDLSNTAYVQGGHMNSTGLNDINGGNFPLSLLPVPRITGIRVGSTDAYLNTAQESGASPLTVILTEAARIDIYKGARLLGTRYEEAGVRRLDTQGFPAGAYPVTLKIYHNGQLSRVMTQYFRNTGDDGVSHTTRWFLQGGEADSGIDPLYTRSNKGHSRTEIAAGVRHELHSGVTWTGAMQYHDKNYLMENDISWRIPAFSGVIELDGGMLTEKDHLVAGQVQTTWAKGNTSLSLSHYQSYMGSENVDSHYCSESATFDISEGQWFGALGLTRTRNASRYYNWSQPFYSRASTEVLDWKHNIPERRWSATDIMLSLGYSAHYGDINIMPRTGVSERFARNQNDKSVFFFLTLSRYQAPSNSNGISSDTRLQMNATTARQSNSMELSQRWAQEEGTWKNFGVSVLQGDKQQNSRVDGEWIGHAGAADLTFSLDRYHGESQKTVSGQYGSNFAITRNGFFWGEGRGDASQLSGMVVDTRVDNDARVQGDIAEVSGSSGRTIRLAQSERVFLPLTQYASNAVDIDNVAQKGANGQLTQGGGHHELFLLPGHVKLTRLYSEATYIYTGRLVRSNGTPLSGGSILNASVPDANSNGGFVAEFSHPPETLYALSQGVIYTCPVHFTEGFNNIRHIGTVSCAETAVASLPQSVRKSRRTSLLLAMSPRKQAVETT
ncbi:TcfC E-set like domain-containing protein [Escherichia coli]